MRSINAHRKALGSHKFRHFIRVPALKDPEIRFPKIRQDDLQRFLFRTDLYDLSDFDDDPDLFEEELRKTADAMTGAVLEEGGGAEGYGYGKGRNILAGQQRKTVKPNNEKL